MPDFKILCDVERAHLRSAIDLSEQLVEHGYVEFARVLGDDEGNAPATTDELLIQVLGARLKPGVNRFRETMNSERVQLALTSYLNKLAEWRQRPIIGAAVARDDARRVLYEAIGREFIVDAYDGPNGEHLGGPAA